MSSAAMTPCIGSDGWNVAVYSTVSTASGVYAATSALNSGLQRMYLAVRLRGLSSQISSFLDHVCAEGSKAQTAGPEPAQTPTREQLEEAAKSLEHLYEIVTGMYRTAQRKGLTNSSLTAGPLRIIRRRSEEFLDLADWVRTFLEHTPSELEEIFAGGRAALERGDVVDLAQIE